MRINKSALFGKSSQKTPKIRTFPTIFAQNLSNAQQELQNLFQLFAQTVEPLNSRAEKTKSFYLICFIHYTQISFQRIREIGSHYHIRKTPVPQIGSSPDLFRTLNRFICRTSRICTNFTTREINSTKSAPRRRRQPEKSFPKLPPHQ